MNCESKDKNEIENDEGIYEQVYVFYKGIWLYHESIKSHKTSDHKNKLEGQDESENKIL